MLSKYVDRMQRALAAEAAYRRSWEGNSKTALRGGRREGRVGRQWRYTFHLPHTERIRSGAIGALHVSGHQAAALVHHVDGSRIILMVDVDLGLTVAGGALFAEDTSHLLGRARDHLVYRWIHGPMNRRLAGFAVFGPSMGGPPPPSPGRDVEISLDGLDPDQAQAVERSTREAVMHLWGPAGTGKTETLAAIAANVVANDQTLLLSAHTNVALDELLERALQRPEVRALALQGRVVRIGSIRSPSLREQWGPEIALESLIEREREAIERSMAPVGEALAELRKEIRSGSEDGPARLRFQELEEEAARLERLHASTPERILAQAAVVAATVTRVTLGQVERMVDAVVLDEASQVSAPLAFSVAGFARKSVVMGGDFRQLAPVVGTSDVAARQCLECSPFESSGVSSAVREGRIPDHLHVLRTQYRLPRALHEPSSSLFYEGLTVLGACGTRAGRLSFFDTGPFGFHAYIPRGSFSRMNLGQADLVVALARHLLAEESEAGSAALISPYVAQAAALRKRIRAAKLAGCEAATVHRFQGQGRPLVILDLTDAPGAPPSRFARATEVGSDGVRLLCVALTRASEHLVVVGDFAHLLEVLPPGAFLRRLIHHLQESGKPLPVPQGWQVPRSAG